MIVRLQTTVSTMIDAAALAAEGRPHGTVVVADVQTGGIGRHGHSWHSPGSGLYLSIILRVKNPVLTLALGLAVQRAIDDTAEVATDIRWPNDILLNDKKVAGIMVQAEASALIAGIGVNVNQQAFPPELEAIATSLQLPDKEALLDRIIAESLRYAGFSKSEVLRQFAARSTWVSGKEVEVDGRIRGVTAGLDEEGFLRVATATGIERILAGGVRPA